MPYAAFHQPQVFFKPLQHLLSSFEDLFASPLDEDGEPYEGESQGFDWLEDRFAEPQLFLRVMLDMLHVFFDREMVGSLFLNGNPSFLFEQVPNGEWQLGYASALSSPNGCLKTLFEEELVPQLQQRDKQYGSATSMFLAVVSHREATLMQLLDEVATFATVGMPVDDAMGRMAGIISAGDPSNHNPSGHAQSNHDPSPAASAEGVESGDAGQEEPSVSANTPESFLKPSSEPFFSTGFAFDDAMGDRVRLSLLSIHPAKPNQQGHGSQSSNKYPHDASSGLISRCRSGL